jgi:hypothetical protein
VDPAAYATQRADVLGAGIDFDSENGNIFCGIWESAEMGTLGGLVVGPYAGCRPNEELVTYQTDPSTTPDGVVGCNGGQLAGDLPAEPGQLRPF